MRWNPVVDAASYGHDPAERLQVAAAAKSAHANGTVSSDIRAEQEKLDAADTIVLQFPMWWFGMPALLKGWFDRVWHQGYAYGRRGSNGEWIGYGDGFLAGKRAMLVVTMGVRRICSASEGSTVRSTTCSFRSITECSFTLVLKSFHRS